MKTMNYLVLIALMIFGASCSESVISEPELTIVKAQSSDEEFDFFNGLEMYKRSAEVQIFDLNELIAELSEAIDAGETGYEEELENALRNREMMTEYRALLDTFRVPLGGRGPGPKPPKGCFVANCFDGINIRGAIGISIPEGTSIERLELINQEGETVGEGTELAENKYGDLMMLFEFNEFEGVATMHITTSVEEGNFDRVMIKIPVIME
jgi:hypothetical protein